MIDNCASGGKRLDFELFRYSLPLWYSDMNCFADYDVRYSLATHIWATAWMPRFASGFQHSEGGDTYACRAVMAQGINFHYYYSVDCELERFPHDWLRERIAEFNLCRDCFAGDVYYLTKPDPDEHCWSVVQYDLPEEGRGVVTAFRGAGCPEFGRAIVFRSLEHQAMYRVWDSDNTISEQVCSGSDLMTRGIAVCMKESRSSRLIFYQKLS